MFYAIRVLKNISYAILQKFQRIKKKKYLLNIAATSETIVDDHINKIDYFKNKQLVKCSTI